MPRSIFILFSIVFVSIITSCTDIYEPGIMPDEQIIYVEGGITTEPGNYQVNIKFAADYNEKPVFKNVTGATVSIIENGSLEYYLEETNPGVYISDSQEFRGVSNNTYQLVIKTPDGNIFESDVQKMPEYNDHIDSVYGYPEVKKLKYYNTYGEFVVREEPVNQIYANIPNQNSQNVYYKFKTTSTLEYISGVITNPGASNYNNIPLYLWESYENEDIAILEVNSNFQSVNKFPLTSMLSGKNEYDGLKYFHQSSIQSEYDNRIVGSVPVEFETDTGIVMVDSIIYGIPTNLYENTFYTGWLLHIQQYSITKEAYNFWSDIKKLEETEGEIFDPIATQLRGNMYCITDKNKVIIGLFEVASKLVTPGFVNFDTEKPYFEGKMIDEVYEISKRGWYDTVPPYFWVDKITD